MNDMRKIKVGDKVKNIGDHCGDLTIGRVYDVKNANDFEFFIDDDAYDRRARTHSDLEWELVPAEEFYVIQLGPERHYRYSYETAVATALERAENDPHLVFAVVPATAIEAYKVHRAVKKLSPEEIASALAAN